jgi:RND family efflux transporter MFP subunit
MLIRCSGSAASGLDRASRVRGRRGRRNGIVTARAILAALGAAAVTVSFAGCSRPSAGTAGATGQSHNSATFPPLPPAAAGAGEAGARQQPRGGEESGLEGVARRYSAAAAAPAGGAPGERPAGYVGVVLARQAVTVAAEADGRLASISVRVGDAVRRGQELAALSTEELRNERAVVQATVAAARGELRRAELELDRTRDRRARREIHPELYSDEDLAGARNAEQEAAAALESAKAHVTEEVGRLRQLETRMQHTVLRAAIDGRVALRYLDAGALVHSGAPVLRLISANDFMLRFAVPPEQAAAIHQGGAVEVRLDSLPVTLPGRVSQVAPRIDPASQMVFVEAELQVPGGWSGRLQDGLPGRVTVRGL